MSTEPPADAEAEQSGSRRLSILLAMAMFVLVVDTSLMNVSISAVITDLNTTASGVQSAIALEALVSAAFILINSKVGDLIGRKRAYVIGLVRLRDRGAGHDPGPEPDGHHHLLGDHRRAGRRPSPARHAVADPRQLLGQGPEAGLRHGRRGCRHRRGRRPAARRLRHDVPVVAGRFRAGGRDHRRRAGPDRASPGRPVHRLAQGRRRRRDPVGRRMGGRRARDPRLAGGRRVRRRAHGRRCRRARVAGVVVGATQARSRSRRCSTRTCSGTRTSPPASRG